MGWKQAGTRCQKCWVGVRPSVDFSVQLNPSSDNGLNIFQRTHTAKIRQQGTDPVGWVGRR